MRYCLWLIGIVAPLAAQQTPPGEVNTPPARAERHPDRLKVGDPAPDFTLPLVKGKGAVRLSSLRDRKPVVLIFASYT
jgi:AhpC/TSA family